MDAILYKVSKSLSDSLYSAEVFIASFLHQLLGCLYFEGASLECLTVLENGLPAIATKPRAIASDSVTHKAAWEG